LQTLWSKGTHYFADRKVQNVFKETCVDKKIPEFAKERREEWQKYKLAYKNKKALTKSGNHEEIFD
jgi:hypothetical protein